MLYFLPEDLLNKLLINLQQKWQVFVPLLQTGGDILLEELPEKGKYREDCLNRLSPGSKAGNAQTIIPPKEVFFPQSEVMFKYSSDSQNPDQLKIDSLKDQAQKTNKPGPRLLFGIKPCDFHALKITDNFFKNGFEDFYYLNKSGNSMAIVFGCLTPPEPLSCFCSSAETGPMLNKNSGHKFDVQFIAEEDGYIVETGSEKGEKFISDNSAFFKKQPAQLPLEKRAELIKRNALKNIKLSVPFNSAVESMRNKDSGSAAGGAGSSEVENTKDLYKSIARRCIYCGACLYVCPTCTCFNVYDNSSLRCGTSAITGGERVRVWDGCVFSGYTREASGHNPRAKADMRAARRYEHKLKYDVPVYGRSSCVGCGRCLTACPVDTGMSVFIRGITENNEK